MLEAGLAVVTPPDVALVVELVSELFFSLVSVADSRKSLVRSMGLELTFFGRDFFNEMGSVILLPKSAFNMLSILNFKPA